MTRHPHGPTCIACTDPAGAAAQMAAHRTELETEAIRAREHRAAGEALEARARDNVIAGRHGAAALLDARALRHLQAANALASGVRFDRARLERATAAHPAVRDLLEVSA